MAKIITLGEIMLRLSTRENQRFSQARDFYATYGGGEANVAASLANFGHETEFISRLPDNALADGAIKFLRGHGVGTRHILRGGERMGIYFLEPGASMRPSRIIYDRARSAMAEADHRDFHWESIFREARWFHWSGITPALSDSAAELTRQACMAAKAAGAVISVDLNFRKKLWSPQKAISVMTPLMEYVDVCIGNEEDAQNCLGFTPEGSDATAGKLNLEGYRIMFQGIRDRFGFSTIASSLRESISADDNRWSGILYDGVDFFTSRQYHIHIIDRVGTGDSFSAGLIHGLLDGDTAGAIDFAVAASALKHTIPGDINLSTLSEVQELLSGDGTGRVQR